MQTKTITYQDAEVSAELTIGRANYRMGLVHSSLIDSARERLFPKKKTEQDKEKKPEPPRYDEDYWIGLFSYPALCAGTVKGVIALTPKAYTTVVDGQSMEVSGCSQYNLDLHNHITWEQYEDLPEELVTQWENAVFELNPHWLPAKPKDEQKKAVGESTES